MKRAMSMKRLAYVLWATLLKVYWSALRSRRVMAMGTELWLTPDTIFPSHRRLRLPKGDCRSEIVRYADHVQMHACCRHLTGLERPVVVDIGAHHGAYAIVLGAMAEESGGRVIAVEPNPASVKILCRNIALNGLTDVVDVEPVAVTQEPCTIALSLDGSETQIVRSGSAESVNVAGEPLADILRRHQVSAVDLLIIDVEGAELDVLRSFPWDDVTVGRIFCEMHPYNWEEFGHTHGEFRRFLAGKKLRCQDMYLTEHQVFEGNSYMGPCLLWRE